MEINTPFFGILFLIFGIILFINEIFAIINIRKKNEDYRVTKEIVIIRGVVLSILLIMLGISILLNHV